MMVIGAIIVKNVLGADIRLEREAGNQVDGYLYYDDDNFTIVNSNSIIVVSEDIETTTKAVRINEEDYFLFSFDTYRVDKGFYIYQIERTAANELYRVGYHAKSGVFEDGWMTRDSEFVICAGNEGVVDFSLYYPENPGTDYEISIYLNDEKMVTHIMTEQTSSFSIACEKNRESVLKICTNFDVIDKGDDIRELALLLTEMVVK